jgi:hypothetical protein
LVLKLQHDIDTLWMSFDYFCLCVFTGEGLRFNLQ